MNYKINVRNLESLKNCFWFPNNEENPVKGKSIHEFKKKCLFQFDEAKDVCRIKYTNDQLNHNSVSLSDHPPIIDKNPLVGGESILHGNKSGMEFKDEIKEKRLNYTAFLEGRVCASVD